jgi:hypothetical protein
MSRGAPKLSPRGYVSGLSVRQTSLAAQELLAYDGTDAFAGRFNGY